MTNYLLSGFILFLGLSAHAQNDEFIVLTIKTGVCHNAQEGVLTLEGRRTTLKKFIQAEVSYLDNCSLLMQSAEQVVGKGSVTTPPSNGDEKDKVWVKNSAEFVDLYNRSHKGHGKGEICLNSDGEISFSIGTDNGSITISSNGTFSLSAKSPSGVEHKVEF